MFDCELASSQLLYEHVTKGSGSIAPMANGIAGAGQEEKAEKDEEEEEEEALAFE